MIHPPLPHLFRALVLAVFAAAPSLRAEDAAEQPPLDWSLGAGDLKGPLTFFGAEKMQTTNVVRTGRDALTATWTGHPECGKDFTVTVTWHRTPDGLWSGDLAYSGYHGSRFIEEIHFPRISAACDEHSAFLFGGDHSGRLHNVGSGPLTPGNLSRLSYCGGTQFSALINTNGMSLYMDHRDPTVSVKKCAIAVSANGRRFTYTGIHVPGLPEKAPAEYRIPYPSCHTLYKGEWFDAGQIYKKWGAAQSWHTRRQGVNPLRKIGIWVWNRGRIDDVIPPVERLQKELGAIPVALDWYWWHSNPYDTDYPDFWPPREGVEPFRTAVARLKRQGIYSQVYVNGVCWDMDGKTWNQGGVQDVVVERNGKPLNIAFNKYNLHRLAYMCGEAPHFQDKIVSLMRHLRGSGLDGQYLDMIGNATMQYRCYNPLHRHPKGGGPDGKDGFRTLLERIRRENPGYPLTTEGCNEAYMDLMDGSIVCNSMGLDCHDAIPLFMSVYHGSYAFFGNFAYPDGTRPWDPLWPSEDRWKEEKPWHRLYPDQFFLELARTVSWGCQPMVCNLKETLFTDPDLAPNLRFIVDSARFYHANLDLLFDGQMLPASGFTCATAGVDYLIRSIFTKEHECLPNHAEWPAILHSCWQAPDGSKALILANWTRSGQKWSFRGLSGSIPPRSYCKLML